MNQFSCLFLCLALSLVCLPGGECTPEELASLGCKRACDKGAGEVCGGPSNAIGTSAEGLVGDKDTEDVSDNRACRSKQPGDVAGKKQAKSLDD
ncbi:single insulin-like growth factor-binding domain protein-2 [Penaeus vannamei]|uniref:single insulin-like growth factor-binding domain protein-2 n=1 Tax=Penaeus vannamei TaxID=6689 RepID=UPI00387F5BD1